MKSESTRTYVGKWEAEPPGGSCARPSRPLVVVVPVGPFTPVLPLIPRPELSSFREWRPSHHLSPASTAEVSDQPGNQHRTQHTMHTHAQAGIGARFRMHAESA